MVGWVVVSSKVVGSEVVGPVVVGSAGTSLGCGVGGAVKMRVGENVRVVLLPHVSGQMSTTSGLHVT